MTALNEAKKRDWHLGITETDENEQTDAHARTPGPGCRSPETHSSAKRGRDDTSMKTAFLLNDYFDTVDCVLTPRQLHKYQKRFTIISNTSFQLSGERFHVCPCPGITQPAVSGTRRHLTYAGVDVSVHASLHIKWRSHVYVFLMSSWKGANGCFYTNDALIIQSWKLSFERCLSHCGSHGPHTMQPDFFYPTDTVCKMSWRGQGSECGGTLNSSVGREGTNVSSLSWCSHNTYFNQMEFAAAVMRWAAERRPCFIFNIITGGTN